jgi:hypothetical protein
MTVLAVGWVGVWGGVEASDDGDDKVADDVSSEKLSPGGCLKVCVFELVGLAFLVWVLVCARVYELRGAGMPRFLRSIRSSRAIFWSVEVDCDRERVRDWDLRVVAARVGSIHSYHQDEYGLLGIALGR